MLSFNVEYLILFQNDMKKNEKKITAIRSDQLKIKHKQVDNSINENDKIRIHRSISWLRCSGKHTDNPDLKFVSLWIAFNACYADNKFAFKQFWGVQLNDGIDWQRLFEKSKINSRNYLANQQVAELLGVVLDRLYTVRNQLLHGSATYMSKVNRSQVRDASKFLEFVIPIIIDIMIINISDYWGEINYLVIR